MRRSLITGAAMLAATFAFLLTSAGAARTSVRASTFTGYGFEACNAPSFDALDAWLTSPYRAIGIYIGGIDRSCANATLTADWVATALADGWNLIPTYVGLQAPCISNTKRARFTAANASTSGTAAADDAIASATALGLPSGIPIYFDMEAYATKNPTCTQTVQAFESAWVTELHAKGYVAGVYGSAASTIRDLQAVTPSPDDVWIANWNGSESVFGDPYVDDTLWANHQRIHQYRGGHRETYGGVTINIDNDFLDGAVVASSTATAPPVSSTEGGSTSTDDGVTSATWPAEAFPGDAQVTLSSLVPGATLDGYTAGGYGVQLTASDATTFTAITKFNAPLTLTVAPRDGALAPVYSRNGTTWKRVPLLSDGTLAAGALTGYTRTADGGVQLQTTVAGTFALVPDHTRPSAPTITGTRFADRKLLLTWGASTDSNGPIVAYRVTLTNREVAETPPGSRRDAEAGFHRSAPSVFRIVSIDAAGNESRPSKPIVVLPEKRPAATPKAIPGWAWGLYDWVSSGKKSPRPAAAPKAVPTWFWTWTSWRSLPYRLRP